MVTETDRNKARSAVVSVYHTLDCVTIPFSFLHAFADAAVDAVSTDAEQAIMDDEDRTPMPAGFDDALWRKADEVHHAMALVARDQECVKIIYAALSTHNAEPVKTAPAVAVKAKPNGDDLLISTLESLVEDNVWSGWAIKQAIEIIRGVEGELPYHCDACSTPGHGDAPCSPLCDRPALSAQVQDVAGWRPIETAPKDGWNSPIITCRMGEFTDWFGKQPVGGYAEPPETAYWNDAGDCWTRCQAPHDAWEPTHWMPLPASPASKHGDAE